MCVCVLTAQLQDRSKESVTNEKHVRPRSPEVCPICGAEVPHQARACPECGADHNSGWRNDADTYDGVELPDHEFNYGEFVRREFGSKANPGKLKPIWWIVGIALLIAFVFYVFASR
jgi:ribosomal protein L40E